MIWIADCPAGLVRLGALDWHQQELRGGELIHTHLGQVVHDHKYVHPSWAAVALLAREVDRALDTDRSCRDVDLILPAPPSRRRWRRLRDLPRCVAEHVARARDIECASQGIVRMRRAGEQKGSDSLEESRHRLAGTFALRAEVAGRRVLLLDDLLGWGGTLTEMARCVRAGKPAHTVGLVFTATLHAPR